MYYGGFNGETYPKTHIALAIGCTKQTVMHLIKKFEADEPEQAVKLLKQKEECLPHGQKTLCGKGDNGYIYNKMVELAK